MERYKKYFKEENYPQIEIGDEIKGGKFKNKSMIVKDFGKDEKNQPTIKTDKGEKKLYAVRIKQEERYKKFFTEELRLSDLMKSASMSDFTKKFNKETNKLMGNPTNHSKLVQMKVNENEDSITFFWVTERTPKYKDNFNMQVVDPTNFTMYKDNLYTIEIKFLEFFSLLNTRPDKNEITNKNIEEVLMNSDIMLWSDVPAYEFQGMNYNMSLFSASLYPENRPPNYWNKFHNSDQLLDKHAAGIVNSIKFYIPQMRMMIKKYMGLTKK